MGQHLLSRFWVLNVSFLIQQWQTWQQYRSWLMLSLRTALTACIKIGPQQAIGLKVLARQFSMNTRRSQLILHNQSEIQKMHIRRQNKSKREESDWEKIVDQQKKQFRVSLIGLPNSGKSTLFNSMIGERLAIVDKLAGMTRDRRQFDIMDRLVKVVDTPGVQVSALGKKTSAQSIKEDIFKQTITAIHESDLIIVVVDGRKPVSSDEIELVNYLRKFGKSQRMILACNKCENISDQTEILEEITRLGIDKYFICSGEQGIGVFEILQHIDQCVPIQLKARLQQLKAERSKKFEQLVAKLKEEMKELEMKGVSIREWQHDFRRINPDPEFNEDLDQEDFEECLIRPEETFSNNRGTAVRNLKMKGTIKMCFIGRPNVGKSSLINELLGEDRMVVSETPHTTRDSISTKIMYKGRKVELIDTAGLNTPNIERNPDEYLRKVQISTMLHVQQSHVVVYVMDSFSAFKIDDFALIRKIIEEGRPLVIAVNKWEAIKEEFKYKAINYLKKQIDENLGHVLNGHPIVFISAKMRLGMGDMMDGIINAYDKWNSRISTGLLNDWLAKFKKLDNLPKQKDMTLKINYLIQARVRPPHFIFFVNSKKIFKDNYLRFVTENIAKQFKMDGIPLRITLRSSNNSENARSKASTRRQRPPKVNPMQKKMEELRKKYNNFKS